ncbi:flagellar hook protein FlgE [Gammaproteobacteria bacterium]|nr:flagellar hook protein FlgE [Gammaproteobacteria bacterium]|tara:strand:+ start:1882 stop:3159 length:1278 start_codon:yes stop_codon:yes gene_type:complete
MSFYTSLTGLNAAAAELSVASNNIANSSTTSFKRSNVSFGDIFASSASSNTATAMGGGVALIGVNQEFSQGGLELSDNALDVAITGDGFFPLASGDGSELYTRNGGFMLNDNNQIVNSAGHTLQVHPLDIDGVSNFNQAMVPLEVKRSVDALPTTILDIDIKLPDGSAIIGVDGGTAINPDDATTYHQAQTISLFDDAGEPYTAVIYYQKIADNAVNGVDEIDTWRAAIHVAGDANAASIVELNFDQNGAPYAGVIGINNADGAFAAQQIAASPVDGRTKAITVNFAAATHTKAFEIVDQTQDGVPEGDLVNINVAENGSVVATYSNGTQQVSGRINLATFTSAQGLGQKGNTVYTATGESGTLAYGEPGSNGVGTLAGGAKERSNVDITEELVKLISAQRNFQSNAKAMETSGTLTQTLINMRG